MNEPLGILSIPGSMHRVDSKSYRWFCKAIASPTRIKFANAEGTYSDGLLVAAEVFAEPNQYFVQVKHGRR